MRSKVIQETISLNGIATPARVVNLTSDKAGIITKLLVKEGDNVKKGKVVAILDSKDLDIKIKSKKIELSSLAAKSKMLEQRAKRISYLSGLGMIPKADNEEDQAAIYDNRASLVRSQAELETLEMDRDGNSIRAPFDGVASQIFAFPGEFVSPITAASDSGQSTKSAIVQIYNDLQIVINSPEALVFDILNAQSITASPLTDTSIRVGAGIDRVMPYVITTKEKASAIPIRLSVADTRPFLPGMNVKVEINKKPIKGLGVKTIAIIKKDGEDGVLSCDSVSHVKFMPVAIRGGGDDISIVAPGGAIKSGLKYYLVDPSESQAPNFFERITNKNPKVLQESVNQKHLN